LRASGTRRSGVISWPGDVFGGEVSPAGCLRHLARSLSARPAGSFRTSENAVRRCSHGGRIRL
jgi:hypothetical protein